MTLLQQSSGLEKFEVIIIDNNSTDATQRICSDSRFSNFKYFIEYQQGLSFARNRGAKEASSNWLLYLDDDVLVDSDLIENAYKWIDRDSVGSFGGSFSPWFFYGRPKWFRDEYASSNFSYSNSTELKGEEFLIGCVFAIRKDLLESVGGFDPALGMRGNTVGYGEETVVQRLLRQQGHSIWFDPELHVRHVVNAERLTPLWYLQAGWALGRDNVFGKKSVGGPIFLIFVTFVCIGLTCLLGVWNGIRLAFLKDYFIENWFIDTFRKTMKRAAVVYYNLIPVDS